MRFPKLLMLVLLLVGVFLPSFSSHGYPPLLSGYFMIVSKHSGKCLDVYMRGTEDGDNVQQWECHGGDNQQWRLYLAGDGQYGIMNKGSGRYLEVSGTDQGAKGDGSNVQQWEWVDGPNQKWELICAGGGYYQIKSVYSGKVLDVENLSKENGGNIYQWGWHGFDNQLWKLVMVTPLARDSSWSGPESVNPSLALGQYTGCIGVALDDLNANGMLDLVVGWETQGRLRSRIGWDIGLSGRVACWSPTIDSVNLKPYGGWLTHGGITTADINGNGRRERVFFTTSYFVIDWDLDDFGKPAKISWHSYGGWIGASTDGAGVAAADLNANGQTDLVFFLADDPDGGNIGVYSIGWDLSPQTGDVKYWSNAPSHVYGGWGHHNDGGGIDIDDIDGDGKLDMILYWIDNPEETNTPYYRVGWGLNSQGTTAKWGPPIELPRGWWGNDDTGGGVAVGDIDGNGLLDLVYVHVDQSAGNDEFFYGVKWDLDTSGH